MQRISDAATITGTKKTADGYLIADAFAARTGIQTYLGSELNRPDLAQVRVYRPEEEVRAADAMASFSHTPVTLGHPKEVNAENWKALAVGEVSTEAVWDGSRIRMPLIIKDAAAIEAVETGAARELSPGYTCEIDWTPGTTPEGQVYDAVQRNIRVNHLAIVPKGRAGHECRIGDGAPNWGASPLTTTIVDEGNPMNTTSVVLGDSAVNVPATEAAKIEAFKADMTQKLADADTARAAVVAEKDKELALKDAQIDELKGKVLTDAQIADKAAVHVALVADAAKIAPDFDVKGKYGADLRRAVVSHVLGDAATEGKSDDYIEARFDGLVAAPAIDPLKSAKTHKVADADPWGAAFEAAGVKVKG